MSILLPSALTHFTAPRPPNDYLGELTSSGTACDVSIPRAVLAALTEVIERDALMIAWLNRLPMNRLDPRGTEVERLMAGPLRNTRFEYCLFDVPTDSPYPVVLAAAFSRANPPHAAVGAACRADHVQASIKALYELSQVLYRLTQRHASRPAIVRTLDDHADYYAASGGDLLLQQALAGGQQVLLDALPIARPQEPQAQLAWLLSWLSSAGVEPIVVDLTPADVASIGYHTLRVVLPAYLDLNVDLRYPRLGSHRLSTVPMKLGFLDAPLPETDLNHLPIPLA